jgi:hypothetical protein
VALDLLAVLIMGSLPASAFLTGFLFISCQAWCVTFHENQKPKAEVKRQDLILMADERQAVHYRYLAAEHVSSASRLAEEGNEAATTQMLHGAIECQGIAEEAEERAAYRRSIEAVFD